MMLISQKPIKGTIYLYNNTFMAVITYKYICLVLSK